MSAQTKKKKVLYISLMEKSLIVQRVRGRHRHRIHGRFYPKSWQPPTQLWKLQTTNTNKSKDKMNLENGLKRFCVCLSFLMRTFENSGCRIGEFVAAVQQHSITSGNIKQTLTTKQK